MERTRRDLLRDGAAAVALAATAPLAAGSGPLAPAARAAIAPPFALGFRSLTDEVHVPGLPVEGAFPRWLTGSLLRNGPALYELGPDRMNHWFDGLAMLHAFSFARGRVSYRNRFLRSSQYLAWRRDGRMRYAEFGTDPCRAIFNGVSTLPVLGRIPNANVSLERWAGRFVAHTELPIPVRFDPRTLGTAGVAQELPTGRMGTAHPHHDARTGERFSYELELVPPSGVRVISERRGVRRELAFVPEPEPGYLHSFAITPRHVALFTQPWQFDLTRFLAPDRGPIVTSFVWHPDRPSRVVLVDRARGGVAATAELDPFFVFHHVNAFERGDKVMLDVCAHRDDEIVRALYLKRIRTGREPAPNAHLTRIEVDPGAGRARVHRLAEGNLELPRIHYTRASQRDYRYAYGVGVRRARFVNQVVKVDVRSGGARTWSDRGCFPGEPIFVRRPGGTREDDGILLSVVLDASRRTSFLLALDARSMEELARARVPHHIPFGFHGLHAA